MARLQLIGGLIAIALLLMGCALSPDAGKKVLEAINDNDTKTANQYICTDKQDKLINALMSEASIPPKGTDVMGLTSPGITDINCQGKDSNILCTFKAPKLQCTGDLFAKGPLNLKCSSFDPNGEPKKLVFLITNGKICGYELQKPGQ